MIMAASTCLAICHEDGKYTRRWQLYMCTSTIANVDLPVYLLYPRADIYKCIISFFKALKGPLIKARSSQYRRKT